MYAIDLEARDLGRESTNTRMNNRIEMLRREGEGIDSGTLRRSAEYTESLYKQHQKGQVMITDRKRTAQIHGSQQKPEHSAEDGKCIACPAMLMEPMMTPRKYVNVYVFRG